MLDVCSLFSKGTYIVGSINGLGSLLVKEKKVNAYQPYENANLSV